MGEGNGERDSRGKFQEQERTMNKSEMQKASQAMRCASRTEKKDMIFFGIEHKMRKEQMEEQFNKETKQGWRFASIRQEQFLLK